MVGKRLSVDAVLEPKLLEGREAVAGLLPDPRDDRFTDKRDALDGVLEVRGCLGRREGGELLWLAEEMRVASGDDGHEL